MPFRIGLVFHSKPESSLVLGPVIELLQKIDLKSAQIRKDEPLTLLPFVRTKEGATLAASIAHENGYLIEAATFDASGVSFRPIELLAQAEHPPQDSARDFDLGMKVLLPRCDAIIAICQQSAELTEIKARLQLFDNTSLLISLAAVVSNEIHFLEIDPRIHERDSPSWLLALIERWEAKITTSDPLPKPKKTILGLLFPILYSAVLGRRSETIKKRKPSEIERCETGMGLSTTAKRKLSQNDISSLSVVLGAICPYFVRHDDLGRHYSNTFRTTCLLVPLLVVAATVLAASAALDSVRQDVWHLLEGIFLIIAAVIFLRSKFANHHRKWVEHRLLAELLRTVILNTFFHTTPQLATPSEEPRLWIDRSRILLKHFRSLPPIIFDSPTEDLKSARISALNDFANYQATWHKDFADQHRVAEKRLTRLSAYSFVFALSFSALQLLFVVLVRALQVRPEVMSGYQRITIGIEHVLLMWTLISAGVAFVIVILLHQLGFEAIAERSSNAAEHFNELGAEIAQTGYMADARQIYCWADKCAATVLAEQHSWYRQIPLIRVHL